MGGNGIFGHWLNDNTFIFGLLDVTHSGIGSALQAAQLMTAIQSHQLEGTDLSQSDRVLAALDRHVRAQSHGCSRAFSIWYGVYCPSKKKVVFSSAGNVTAALVNSRGRVTRLTSLQPKIGELSTGQSESKEETSAEFTPASHPLKSGNTLYLFSSGLATAKQSSLCADECIQLLLDSDSRNGSDDILPEAVKNVCSQLGIETFEDDVSLVRLRVK